MDEISILMYSDSGSSSRRPIETCNRTTPRPGQGPTSACWVFGIGCNAGGAIFKQVGGTVSPRHDVRPQALAALAALPSRLSTHSPPPPTPP